MQEILVGQDRSSVGERIGKGGEGEVYSINGKSGLAVKIYNAGLRTKRKDKVRAMVSAGLARKTDLVAYPSQIVSDRRGNFLGFAMRLVLGYRPLHELYSPKCRQRHFPTADYRFVIRAAQNVARAVGKVHQTGCVIGDLNHSGVLVAKDATVALIDADSFQFRLDGKSYPCVVGVPDFTPPELHGKNLGTVERSIEHDNFGLAVAIFQLLFMGRHPYAGRHNGPDIPMGEAIAQNRFAFSLNRRSATQTVPPPGALTLDLFPQFAASAFERAFGLEPRARPGASDWIGVLTKLESSLKRCTKSKTHYYPSTASSCVWCEQLADNSFDMFPDLSADGASAPVDARATEQAIQEILAFGFPTTADLLPQPTVSTRGSSALRETKSGARGKALLGWLMIAGAIAGMIFATPAWFAWLALGVWGWNLVAGSKVNTTPFIKAFESADQQVQRELDSFIRRNGLSEVMKVRSDIEVAINGYRSHNASLARDLEKLKSTREDRQRTAFLDQFSIRSAGLPGIGPSKTATLISFGIETATDVTRSAVRRVPGFGEVLTGKLVDWRRSREALFKYDPKPNAQDVAHEQALRAQHANVKAKYEAVIRSGLGALRNAKGRLESLPAKAHRDRSLLHALEDRARAEQDLRLLDASIPTSAVVLFTAPSTQPTPQPARAPAKRTSPRQGAPATASNPSCPRCGAAMRRRSGRYGQFWGCSRYPSCRGTRDI